MNIGIDASRANKKNMTGTEWYSYYVIKYLIASDTSNHYTLYFRENNPSDLFTPVSHVTARHIQWPLPFFWTQGAFSLEMLIRKPDVLFIPAHVIPFVTPSVVVTTCHDIGFERYPELYSKRELRYHRYAMKKAIQRARKIITVSEFSKQEIQNVYGVDGASIEVIYHGYDSDVYNADRNDTQLLETQKKYEIDSPYLVYIGRKEKKKNTAGLIEIFQRLKRKSVYRDLKLVLIGGEGAGYAEVRKKIDAYDLSDDVIELGWLPQRDAVSLLKSAACFVFPSYYEGFGMPVLEAFASGVPVVCSNRASLPEVADNAAILVDPDNHAAFADAIDSVLGHERIRIDLKQAGFERAKYFSWERCAQQTLFVLTRANDV